MSNITTTNTSQDMFDIMDKAYKFATIMAKSDIIPTHYRAKPENVFIAVQTAYRMNIDPMLVMQNTFVVNGKLGMTTSFAVSLANQSNIFKGPFSYVTEGEGVTLKVTAKAIVAKTGEEVSATVTMKMATDEGWIKNNKYRTMPEHMLIYRAAIFLIRRYCPEVINGMHTVEELEDVKAAETKDITPETKTQSLSAKLDSFLDTEILTPEVTEPQEKEELIQKLQVLLDHKNSKELDDKITERCDSLGIKDPFDMSITQLKSTIEWIEKRV